MKPKQIPPEVIISLRQRLSELPPRSSLRMILVKETASLYGVSVDTVYRALKNTKKAKTAHHSDPGKLRRLTNNKNNVKIVGGYYQLIKRIGRGSFGQTYLAKNLQQFGNPCLVKRLQPIKQNPEYLEIAKNLFEKEARVLLEIGNDNNQFPSLIAYFSENNNFYLVQEFIKGHELSLEIVDGQPWSESEVIKLLEDILLPLSFLHHHSQPIIHRDLKPSNLMRRAADNKIVLIDFGAIKELAVTEILNNTGKTRKTMVIGTPGYMPPEQSFGYPKLSSDVYAVGVIAIKALTGLHPNDFDRDAEGEIILSKQTSISIELNAILRKMVRYYHKERYNSAVEALEAIKKLQEDSQYMSTVDCKYLSPSSLVETKPFKINHKKSALNIFQNQKLLLRRKVLKYVGVMVAIIALILTGKKIFELTGVNFPLNDDSFHLQIDLIKNININSSKEVWSLAVSPQRKIVASGSDNGKIDVYDQHTGQKINILGQHENVIRSLVFRPETNNLIAGDGDGIIKIWNIETSKIEQQLQAHFGTIWSLTVSPDGQTLVSGGEDKTIRIWNLNTGEQTNILFTHSAKVFSLAFSPDGQMFASSSADNTIKIWNPNNGKLLKSLSGHQNAVRSIAITPDNKYLVSGSWDKTIKIWELKSGNLISTLEGHKNRVVTVAVSQDSQIIFSGSIDNTIKVWSIENAKLINTLEQHYDWILALASNLQENLFVSSSKDGTLKLWTYKYTNQESIR